jgi:hypothetical protein
MIVDHYEKRVIFTPPKTGSLHLQECLSKYPGIYIVHGPNPINFFDHHTICIEVGHINYEKILLVRHPIDRFYSLWKHYFLYDSKPKDFNTFFDMVINDDKELYWIYRYTICRWLKYSEHIFSKNQNGDTPIDSIWKLENINHYINKYYPRVTINSKYTNNIEYPELTEKQNKLLLNWIDEDIKRFYYVV